ncbi:DEAD/DEAH box helicase [Hespellia stercorisuis]|uniref:Superfamily II DNA or RNA helicase n=1 Tax=Hespellia stercorisuis DSM 15480 TaxID=1121950 RepID=A0A1M6NVD9_9FIRM|nr:DEAD/DEAH box helicase family protein [Hespellia stercorisuis]SHJ99673.1 Superfamily II DNA or RNA helicase [Hespellia stercorisuis DSM 15480]
MRVTERIGDEYTQWSNGDIILISAPTGSGKSYFVLHVLLKYIIRTGGKLLYLVNRKVLKKQLDAELKNKVIPELSGQGNLPIAPIGNYIEIETYQSVECFVKKSAYDSIQKHFEKFSCLVCDESHYFYSDSNFNTRTELAYDCLCDQFQSKLHIYMSATMEQMSQSVLERATSNFQIAGKMMRNGTQERIKIYEISNDYDFVDLHVFETMADLDWLLINAIRNIKEKWLIFTDSIERGKNIKDEIVDKILENPESKMCEEDVVFIDADYAQDKAATDSVMQVAEQECTSKKIIIATAVLDNGVSFKDCELRNIVILVDDKEEFIQMLGRKRISEEHLNLYICKRDIGHFKRRIASLNVVSDFYEKFGNDLYNSFHVPVEGGQILLKTPYEVTKKMWAFICSWGWPWGMEQQEKVLHKILESRGAYEAAKKLCYSVKGVLACNSFAVQRYRNLKSFYAEMVEAISADEWAFVEKQASWIGKSKDDCKDIHRECGENMKKHYREQVIEVLERIEEKKNQEEKKYLDKYLGGQEKTELKLFIREPVKRYMNVIGGAEGEIDYRKIERRDGGFDATTFNEWMEWMELPYVARNGKSKTTIIQKIENTNL